MPWIAQINFRQFAIDLTDAAGQTWSVTDPSLVTDGFYDQNRAGLHFGYTSLNVSARTRNSGADPRIAGLAFSSGGMGNFRLDLPATGAYLVKIVLCDLYAGGAGHDQYLKVYDDASILFAQDTASGFTTASLPAADISGTQYTAAGIVSANMGPAQTMTFATTILRLELGDGATRGGNISHLYVEQVEAVTGAAGGAFNQTIIRTRARR